MSKKASAAKKKQKKQPCEQTGYRYYGRPDKDQTKAINGTLGSCRWLYNRMLSDRSEMYRQCGDSEKRSPAWYKGLHPYGDWLKEADSLALANVELNLENAYDKFFSGEGGYPTYKRKSNHHDSYTTNMVNGNIKVRFANGHMLLKLPKVKGEIELFGRWPAKGGKLKSVTVTHEPNGRYYFSLLYEYPKRKTEDHRDTSKSVGLDMSMHEFCVASEGEHIDHEHPFRKTEKKLAREQRRLSHMKKGSSNYEKQRVKVARLHSKVKNQRTDFAHKLSRRLVDEYDIIGIEDLNMQGLAQSLNFGKSVSDKGWGMFVRFLMCKAERAGKHVIKVSKWFPSSQRCHECGTVFRKTKDLSIREWTCPHCGHHHDRDVNAALNIRDEALRIFSAT